jgi:hypothetical protein
MPTNKPFFPSLRPVKRVITPKGEFWSEKNASVVKNSWVQPLRRAVKNALRGKENGNEKAGAVTTNDVSDSNPARDFVRDVVVRKHSRTIHRTDAIERVGFWLVAHPHQSGLATEGLGRGRVTSPFVSLVGVIPFLWHRRLSRWEK